MSLLAENDTTPIEGVSIEGAVEHAMAVHLREERSRFFDRGAALRFDFDECSQIISDFEEWAAAYDVQPSGHVMAAYIAELHHCSDADMDDLANVARALLVKYDFDTLIPISAALRYCATTPRTLEAPLH
jgi:hypothetical protein